jgi:hypothetical protein
MSRDIVLAVFLAGLGVYLISVSIYYFVHPDKHSPIVEMDRRKLYILLRIRFVLGALIGIASLLIALYLFSLALRQGSF